MEHRRPGSVDERPKARTMNLDSRHLRQHLWFEVEVAAPNVPVGVEAGILAEVAVSGEVVVVVRLEAEVALGVFGTSWPVAPSSVFSVR